MYRKNVCVAIFNEDLRFLGCRRIQDNLFQFVQGGIEKDADLLHAAYREVYEETSLCKEDLHFVGEVPPPSGDPREFRYELRRTSNLRNFGFQGQEQRVLLFFTDSGNIEKVNVIPPKETCAQQEFSEVHWMELREIIDRCPREKIHIFLAVAKVGVPMARAFLQSRSALKKDSI
ncbi:putative Nudix hydrolase 2 [Trypanosoma cruzi]|uniref:Nudix hydrolase domain-containing protein n=2 Tax=Trypanosoma cruzi TaxID=5693 RepID=Q4DDM6_TRYCC|nr:hypothetical protein, conserved [Trypanosoma cruzi]EAN90620.1 hypothetical protein, conserved [Trypanosoma cruzi]PWV02078.1 putative Nudix hydrolase 2 [Trypanosoma cruzi]RNC43991.1 putative NUDIX hydrolase, conserved [Trypanosoma cruzi]|eukprot:XP_812471.1 hypothetical protein [Trypanosoma cruzi strain CL Brener]